MATDIETEAVRTSVRQLLKSEQGREALEALMTWLEVCHGLADLDDRAALIVLEAIAGIYPKTALGEFNDMIATEKA